MVPAGNKAKRLSLVNHTTITIRHHHHLAMLLPTTCKNVLGILNILDLTHTPNLLQYQLEINFTILSLRWIVAFSYRDQVPIQYIQVQRYNQQMQWESVRVNESSTPQRNNMFKVILADVLSKFDLHFCEVVYFLVRKFLKTRF